MKIVRSGLAVAALLVAGTLGASAQMVVNPNIGERVDYPFDTNIGRRFQGHHHYRHRVARYHPRFFIIRSSFPTPQPFGWANCCQKAA